MVHARFVFTYTSITKHILVKRNHVLKIVHADDQMIDVGDIDGVSLFHDGVLYFLGVTTMASISNSSDSNASVGTGINVLAGGWSPNTSRRFFTKY